MLQNLKKAGQGVLWLVATFAVAALLGFISQLLTGDPFWLAQYTPNELVMALVGTLFQIFVVIFNSGFWYQPWPGKSDLSGNAQHWTDRLAFWIQLLIVAASWFAAARMLYLGGDTHMVDWAEWGIFAIFALSLLERWVFRGISLVISMPYWVLYGIWKGGGKLRGPAATAGSWVWGSWFGKLLQFLIIVAILFAAAMLVVGIFS